MIRISGAVMGAVLGLSMLGVAGADEVSPVLQYQVRLPKGAVSCAEEAAALGARFERATAIHPLSAECTDEVTLKADGQTYTLYTLSVNYQTDAQPLQYSANYGLSDTFDRPNEQQGVYTTYADCLAARAAETATFESQTGLPAVSSFCEPGAYSYSVSYVLRIDSFGQPQKTLRRFEVKYLGDADAALDARVEGLMTSLGATIVNRTGGQKLFYAPGDYAVKYDLIAGFTSESECKTELSMAEDIYAKLESKAVVAVCLPTNGTHWYLQAVREGYFFLSSDMGSGSPRFYSYEECRRARSRIRFEDRNAIGGICHASDFSEGQYELDLYSSL